MSLRDLFSRRPRWQHRKPEVRLRALAEDPLTEIELQTITRTDEDPTIRHGAVSRLQDHAFVLDLSQESSPLQQVAVDRYVTLVDPAMFATLAPEQLLLIARQAALTETRLAAAEHLSCSAHIEDLLDPQNHSLVNQACARRLESTASLTQAHRQFRGSDKSVARICRERLDQLQCAEREATTLTDSAQTLLVRLQSMDQRTPENLSSEAIAGLATRFDEIIANRALHPLASVAVSAISYEFNRVKADIANCLALHEAAVAEAQSQANALETTVSRCIDALQAATDELPHLAVRICDWRALHAGIDTALAPQDSLAGIGNHLGQLDAVLTQYIRWQDRSPTISCAIATTTIGPLKDAIGNLSWPDGFAEPEALTLARQVLGERRRLQAEEQKRIEAARAALKTNLDEFGRLIDDGKVSDAHKLAKTLTKPISAESTGRREKDRYTRLTGKLRKLDDWRNFATVPKREALCEQMQALGLDLELGEREKADQIRALQNQWKDLGAASSRREQELWQQFHGLANEAYAPCQRYFDELREQRESHLQACEAICEGLESAIVSATASSTDQATDQSVDWKSARMVASQARNQWRQFDDVPRSARRPIGKRYHNSITRLQQLIDAETEANHDIKQALIEQATALVTTNDDLDAAIRTVKELQTTWKTIGITEQRKDQKMWSQFREHCDALFARREEQSQVQREAYQAHAREGRELIQKIRDAASTKDGGALINNLRAEFEQLDGIDHKLQKDFDSACNDLRRARSQKKELAVTQELAEARRRTELCRQVESGTPHDSLIDQWDDSFVMNETVTTALTQRWQAAVANNVQPEEQSANLTRAELLCVRMEILAAVESPPAARELRLRCQVEDLNQKHRGAEPAVSGFSQLTTMQTDWYSLGTMPAGQSDLFTRFERAEHAATKVSGRR